MKSKIFKSVLAINIFALITLFVVWWINGRDDTLMYVTFAIIVLASFLYIKPHKKDNEQEGNKTE